MHHDIVALLQSAAFCLNKAKLLKLNRKALSEFADCLDAITKPARLLAWTK